MRLDLLLVQKKLATSRTHAQEIIKSGYVFLIKDQKKLGITKPSLDILESDFDFIEVLDNPLMKYVSRGGLKLEAALKYLCLDINGFSVLDIGQSTGGFTDCLLQMGAKHIVGIDVGQNQLHEKIKMNSKVRYFESLHVKDIASHKEFLQSSPQNGFDLVVADVSFISITKIIAYLKPFLKKDQGRYLLLVKPQFEAGPNALDKNGIVKDEKTYSIVQNLITKNVTEIFGSVNDYFKSDLVGKDGNQEFFIYGTNTKTL